MKKSITKTKIKKKFVLADVPRPKKAAHYTAKYIINPAHPVTINVIGCGGTGSQIINSLARMNSALKAIGHTGFFVRAIDPDKVTEANMGRQLFSPSDLGNYKCMSLIGRINRFFGTDWEGLPSFYNSKSEIISANITISCVDTGASRKEIKTTLELQAKTKRKEVGRYGYSGHIEPYEVPYYWMDFGNMRDRGQVVIGTVQKIKQPDKSEFSGRETLPSINDLHPDIFKDSKDDDQGPSCSLADALHKQDLFINTNLANMGLCILWKMFRELYIKSHGLYINLNTMQVNAININ